MALVTTPGDASADSYADLAEANTYNANRLHAAAWIAATDPTKEAGLRWAAILLDGNPRSWSGAQAASTQALRWPRTGMATRDGFAIPSTGATSIPKSLKDAQSEFARQLIGTDRTTDNAIINQNITELKAGSVGLRFGDLVTENSSLVARSIREMNALAAVLPDAVKFLLVPSWLLEDAEDEANSQFIFETL